MGCTSSLTPFFCECKPPNERMQLTEHSHIPKVAANQLLSAGCMDVKVLVVGTGNSGKSTFLKQLKILLMDGFSVEELKILKPNIYDSIVTSMNMMTKSMKDYNIDFQNIERLSDAVLSQTTADDNKQTNRFSLKLADALVDLWKDSGIQSAYVSQGESIHLANSTKYLFDDMERIRAIDYVPSYQDILECRTTTAGAVKYDFQYSGIHFSMTDVGGQRSLRKKWSNFYSDIEGVIFVVGLSEYDQAMQEDEDTNRIHDALNAFSDVANNTALADKPIILLFNKYDLFKEKLPKVPLTTAFRDYHGGNDCEAASEYITLEFLKQVHGSSKTLKRKGTIYPYFTHATKTDDVKETVLAVLDILKTKALYSSEKWGAIAST